MALNAKLVAFSYSIMAGDSFTSGICAELCMECTEEPIALKTGDAGNDSGGVGFFGPAVAGECPAVECAGFEIGEDFVFCGGDGRCLGD